MATNEHNCYYHLSLHNPIQFFFGKRMVNMQYIHKEYNYKRERVMLLMVMILMIVLVSMSALQLKNKQGKEEDRFVLVAVIPDQQFIPAITGATIFSSNQIHNTYNSNSIFRVVFLVSGVAFDFSHDNGNGNTNINTSTNISININTNTNRNINNNHAQYLCYGFYVLSTTDHDPTHHHNQSIEANVNSNWSTITCNFSHTCMLLYELFCLFSLCLFFLFTTFFC